jgi:hypothetical protein
MNCKNCQIPLLPESDYCHQCGAKIIRNRLTLKSLFSHLIETFFSYDNTFLQTTVQLLKNPKDVIDSYVQGVRKKYIAPLAFFAVAITISGLYLFIIKKYFPQFFDFADSLYTDDISRDVSKKISEFTTEFNSLLNFLFIPFIALLSRIVFYNNRYNFTEHLVIYFYTMSLFSIFSVITNLIILTVIPDVFLIWSSISYLLLFFYHCYALKSIFTLSIKKLLLKIILFIPLFLISYIGVSLLLFLLALLTGYIDLNELIPKQY